MKHLLRRRDTDALLDGDPVGDDSGLDDVAAFLSDMRVEFGALPAPAPRPTLAATLDGRRELRPASSGPVPKPTIPEPGPRVHYRFKPIAAMVASGVVLFGGLATAGALPGPAQRSVADVTSHLGINLPGRTVIEPASDGDHTDKGHGTIATTPGTGQATVPGTPGVSTQPTTGSTTVTTVPAVGATIPSPPSTVTIPPNLPTTPTLPVPTLPVPTPTIIGALPPLGALPTIPGITEPLSNGVLRKHPIP